MIDLSNLDKIIHEKGRLAITTLLASRNDDWTFQTLKAELEMSDGNLITHLRTLEKAEYVSSTKKTPKAGRATTHYKLTPTGRENFNSYLDTLEKLFSTLRKDSD